MSACLVPFKRTLLLCNETKFHSIGLFRTPISVFRRGIQYFSSPFPHSFRSNFVCSSATKNPSKSHSLHIISECSKHCKLTMKFCFCFSCFEILITRKTRLYELNCDWRWITTVDFIIVIFSIAITVLSNEGATGSKEGEGGEEGLFKRWYQCNSGSEPSRAQIILYAHHVLSTIDTLVLCVLCIRAAPIQNFATKLTIQFEYIVFPCHWLTCSCPILQSNITMFKSTNRLQFQYATERYCVRFP